MIPIEHKSGFSLVELLVVISIIAVLIAVGLPNFLGARQRAKDTRKKAELTQMKTALRLYYNDYAQYPGPAVATTGQIDGCGDTGTVACTNDLFCVTSAGACSVIYMKRMPDTTTDYVWTYTSRNSAADFCLWTSMDNPSDPQIAASQAKCSDVCVGAGYAASDFLLCAD